MVLLQDLATTGWMWDRLVAATEDELHLLVVDLPGHGASNGRPWISSADTADAVAGIVTTRGHGGTA